MIAIELTRLPAEAGAWATSWRARSAIALSGLSWPSYWLVGAAFVSVYLGFERATFVYQLDGLGITLWGPAAGLSVVFLLAGGLSFAPFVFVASLLSDFVVYYGPRGTFAPIGTSVVLCAGFSAMALVLRNRRISARPSLNDVITLLVVVPVGTLLIAVLYCAVLFAADLVSSWRFVIALRNFWIGDTLGIVTILPAATILRSRFSAKPPRLTRTNLGAALTFAMLVGVALWVIFGLRRANEYQFFYLLFLPVVWVAVRWGYAAITLALLFTHVLLVTIASLLGYTAYDFIAFQMLMLVLSATGLLLGAAVTERRCSEERMRGQQLELARAARHAIVGATGTAIAHEISQPLSSATSYLHAARRLLRNPQQDLARAEQALDGAETEARRARETLERVRDYVASGRLELSDVDIEHLVGKITTLMQREARGRGVHIGLSSSRHLPLVRADRIQLEQLLVNLLSNAIDAAADGPSNGQVAVRISQRRDRIAIDVEDNGLGIASAIVNRLFEPFETTKPKGMGLGLTLARQIVDAHGGDIRCENIDPCGARFAVELPVDGPLPHG